MPARINAKLDKIIKKRFKTSYMSNAKWRKLFIALDQPEINIEQCCWKFVDCDYDFLGKFPKSNELMEKYVGDYGSGPFAFKQIEWVEICKVFKPGGYEKVPITHYDQDIDEVINILNKVGHFEIETTDKGLRIFGHK